MMNKGWKLAAFGVFVLLIMAGIAVGVRLKKQEHLRFAARLGAGFNLGNALDATNLWETTPDAPELSYETYWGNPPIDDTQLAAISSAGFSSVRIPVTWEDHIDENGVISQTWIERVAEVVDLALAEELYVILDTHHEDWLNLDTEREEEINARYKTVWSQIALRFADYNDHLIFEGMNEPRLRDSEHEWDAGTPELRAMVNRLNRTFVETVREAGGKNSNRYLMISAYATGTETEALADLEVPDGNVIVSVHMYQPYSFCQDREGTAEWDAGNADDTEKIEKTFAELHTRFIEQGIPVVLSEFGCVDKENDVTRAVWVSFYREQADIIPCFWWDNGSSYQLLDRESGRWMHPEILDALTTGENKVYIGEDDGHTDTDNIAEVYCNIYEEAIQTGTADSLEIIESIVDRLGENGYTAVDSENQIDMTEPERVLQFCEKTEAGEKAELTVIVVPYSDGYIKYDFSTQDGNVDIVREYYQYVDGHMECKSMGNFRADVWKYTEDGYLVFEGDWFSEESYVLTLSNVPERAALRVEPLDEKCRELNREYMLTVGYGHNNMFLTDWSEDNFGELNFYDLYDIFYPLVYGQAVPYTVDKNLGVGAVYRIPKEEFESVIMAYVNIDSETLQSKTAYFPGDEEYEYKPRGFYETEYPELPYPEVVSYAENSDGTITLTVNAVYPNEIVSKIYSHEVVIRPLNDGSFRYVSNHVISSDDNHEQTWHVPRLTEEEWEERYGD